MSDSDDSRIKRVVRQLMLFFQQEFHLIQLNQIFIDLTETFLRFVLFCFERKQSICLTLFTCRNVSLHLTDMWVTTLVNV